MDAFVIFAHFLFRIRLRDINHAHDFTIQLRYFFNVPDISKLSLGRKLRVLANESFSWESFHMYRYCVIIGDFNVFRICVLVVVRPQDKKGL